MKRAVFQITLLLLASLCLAAPDTTTSYHVKIHRHRSDTQREFIDRSGGLTFDDASRTIRFQGIPEEKSEVPDKFDVSYDSISKVVFEVTNRMRGGVLPLFIAPISPAAGISLAQQHVDDYWFYFEYKNGDQTERILLKVPNRSANKVVAKALSAFGPRVTLNDIPQEGKEIEKKKLPGVKSKEIAEVDRQNHPLPEVKPGKATVVVVCPSLGPSYVGHGSQFKLHANDQVIAVNRQGTYSFAYLDPGKYQFVSQSENANGFEMQIEEGKSYYFLQNTFMGAVKWETSLSRNSPELVNYLLEGSYYSDWKRQ